MPVKTKKGERSPLVSGASCAICDNEVASEEIAKCIECKKRPLTGIVLVCPLMIWQVIVAVIPALNA